MSLLELIEAVSIGELRVFSLLVLAKKRDTGHTHEALTANFAHDRLARLIGLKLTMGHGSLVLSGLSLAAHLGLHTISLRHFGGGFLILSTDSQNLESKRARRRHLEAFSSKWREIAIKL